MFNLSKYRIVKYKDNFHVQRRMPWEPWTWESYEKHDKYYVSWLGGYSRYVKQFTTVEAARETLMEICKPRTPTLIVIEEYNA